MKEIIKGLKEFLDYSHSQYHSVNYVKNILLKNNAILLDEKDSFKLEKGKTYVVTRSDTSLIAFKIPTSLEKDFHFQLVASHSDSPTFKIKENSLINDHGYQKLRVEGYGGMINNVWLDKPLSLAGRVVYEENGDVKYKLIDIDKDLLIIPNVAIHLNRNINSGFSYNPEIDLLPIIGMEANPDVNLFNEAIKEELKEGQTLISHDLYLYNRQKATVIGQNESLFASAKLDNLASAYSTLLGFLEGEPKDFISVYVLFDNEEVGSSSINGADSSFLEDILRRITLSFNKDEESYYKAIARSIMFSVDNAHALHPNHKELSDASNAPILNEGIVIKHNANMRYTSDGLTTAITKAICNSNKIKYQDYHNRSDIRGGSTLGNISLTHVSLLSVDLGLPQLAMHSNYELMGVEDLEMMKNFIKIGLGKTIIVGDKKVSIK